MLNNIGREQKYRQQSVHLFLIFISAQPFTATTTFEWTTNCLSGVCYCGSIDFIISIDNVYVGSFWQKRAGALHGEALAYETLIAKTYLTESSSHSALNWTSVHVPRIQVSRVQDPRESALVSHECIIHGQCKFLNMALARECWVKICFRDTSNQLCLASYNFITVVFLSVQ